VNEAEAPAPTGSNRSLRAGVRSVLPGEPVSTGERTPAGRFASGNKVLAALGGKAPRKIKPKAAVRKYLGKELLEALALGTETLPSAFDRWAELLQARDARVRLEAEKFLHEVTNGRAPLSLEVKAGGGGGALVLRWTEAQPIQAPALAAVEPVTGESPVIDAEEVS
jgi:hypothetical protein